MEKLQPDEVKKIFIVVLIVVFLITATIMMRFVRTPTDTSNDREDKETVQVVFVSPTNVTMSIPSGRMFISLGTEELTDLVGDVHISAQIQVGETVVARVRFDPAQESLSGADAILRFDPTILSVVEPIVPGSTFAQYPRKTVDQTSGIIKVTGYGVSSEPADGILASITFRALREGFATIDLDFSPGSTNKSTLAQKGTGKNILGTVEGATITISNF